MGETCPNTDFFWSILFCVRTEYGEFIFNLNLGKYWPEETPYLDTFQAVIKRANNPVIILILKCLVKNKLKLVKHTLKTCTNYCKIFNLCLIMLRFSNYVTFFSTSVKSLSSFDFSIDFIKTLLFSEKGTGKSFKNVFTEKNLAK